MCITRSQLISRKKKAIAYYISGSDRWLELIKLSLLAVVVTVVIVAVVIIAVVVIVVIVVVA